MSSYVQNVLQRALGDGARASKFDCNIIFKNQKLATPEDFSTVIKTTSFPSKAHSKIDLNYRGRSIPIKGQTKYNQTWTATFYLSQDHKLKNAFEVWIESLDQQHNYVEGLPGVDETIKINANEGYTSTILLYQKDFKDEEATAVYTLFNAFPVEITELEYSAESVGQILEFTVTFAYSNYTLQVMKGGGGNFVDELVQKVLDFAQDAANSLVDLTGGAISSLIGGSEEESQTVKDPKDMGRNINDEAEESTFGDFFG